MHVRGSSKKESIDFNFKLVVLLLFEDDLYMYVKLDESRTEPARKIQFVQNVSSKNFHLLNNHTLFFLSDVYPKNSNKSNLFKNNLLLPTHQKIERLEIGFSTISVHDVI